MARRESRRETSGKTVKQSPTRKSARETRRDDDLDLLRERLLVEDEPDFEDAQVLVKNVDDGKIFGLNAVERMFLSIGLFLVVSVLSVLLLLMTDSIAIP